MGRLRILTPGIEPAELELRAGVNTLGRREGNAVCVLDGSVSGRHCELTEGGGVLTLRDLGSTNGSFIAGARSGEGTIASGQTFRVGSVEIAYEADEAAPAPAAVVAQEALVAAPPASAPVASPPVSPPTPAVPTPPGAPPVRVGPKRVVPVVRATPAPALPPAAPPPVPESSETTRTPQQPCSRHASKAAEYVCTKCGTRACGECVKKFDTTGKGKRFCPVCSNKCIPVEEWSKAQGARLLREAMTFRQRLPGVFKYPFGPGGIPLLVFGTILFIGLDFLVTWGWRVRYVAINVVSYVGIIALFSAGYLSAYLQKVVHASAQGEDDVPGWPEFSNWWDDIVMPFLLALWAGVASFAPAFGYMFYHLYADTEMSLTLLFPLFALGFLYFPMALLAVAMSNSFLAVNPLVVLPAITRLNLEYVAATVVFFALVLTRYLSETLLHRFVPVPLLPTVVSGFLALYFLAAEMRLLGTMYYANRKRLAWFRH